MILNRVAGKGFTEKLAFEWRLTGGRDEPGGCQGEKLPKSGNGSV